MTTGILSGQGKRQLMPERKYANSCAQQIQATVKSPIDTCNSGGRTNIYYCFII
jgi:hypothetical protein